MDSSNESELRTATVSQNKVEESLRGFDGEADLGRVRTDVLQFLKEKRYEDALELLYWARSKLPQNAELQRSVDQVKELLMGSYAKRLGGLDQVAGALQTKPKRSPDFLLLSRYIDGSSTYGDLARICPLGRVRTLQLLVELYCPESDASGEPRSGERAIRHTSADEASEEKAPITRRSNSSLPPGGSRAARDELPSPRPAPESNPLSRPAPESKRYKIPMPGESHPFANEKDGPYRQAFERGTAAYVGKRFEEAVAAFEECLTHSPADPPAEVMLRNARRELSFQ